MSGNTSNDLTIEAAQRQFTLLPTEFVYMNNGTEGSMPARVMAKYIEALEDWTTNPTIAYEIDPLLGKQQKENRQAMAEFLGVGLDNICLTDSTTMGLSMVLMGLNIGVGERVVVTNHEHPCVVSPLWILKRRLGVEVEVVDFPEPQVLRHMGASELLDHLLPEAALKNAKALCVSHVYPTLGVRLPLDEVRRRAKDLGIAYLIVDGAQAVGMLDLNRPENKVTNCDFYAGSTHKWMNGPPGTGWLYINNCRIGPPEFWPLPSQKMAAYVCDDNSDSRLPMAEALQVRGCSSTPAYVAVIEVLRFFDQLGGQAPVERHILGLSSRIRALIESKSPRSLISPGSDMLRSGLTSFYAFDWNCPDVIYTDEESARRVVDDLKAEGIQVRYIPFPTVDMREDCCLRRHDPGALMDCSGNPVDQTFAVRVSTALFNTEADIARFAEALEKVLSRIGRPQQDACTN